MLADLALPPHQPNNLGTAAVPVTVIAGLIGWVRLAIPHIARMLVGLSFGRLLPASALIDAGYLLLVDTAARTIATIEVPLVFLRR